MYNCFILDRLMSYGMDRPLGIASEGMLIQLPCSEMAFDLSLDVRTGLLHPQESQNQSHINNDSTLSRFVKLAEVWGEISRYSAMGGWLQETHPPWDPRSTFFKLREKLMAFNRDLPDTFTLSRQNYYRHENHQAANTYVSLHMLASVCQIILNRECLPFLPLRYLGPQGPLDTNKLTPGLRPDGFWEENADNVFQASRNIIELVGLCKEKLPLSSLTVFSLWLVGFMAVYAQHFPHMDVKERLRSRKATGPCTGENLSALEHGHAGTARQALRRAVTYLPSAQRYLENLEAIDRCFTQAKNLTHGSLSLRLGEAGHGIEPNTYGQEAYDTHHKIKGSLLTSPQLSNSPMPMLEEPPKATQPMSKSQLSLPRVDEESSAMDAPNLLVGDIGILESQRMSSVLKDLEAFSGAGSLRVVF
ncbi:transcriptional regulatory [Fusarium beomiforme]|uniref:Transcriptional regulatory n=1 Tax=Fusarium beomiforme TaxID=44412 RepID=A0A9P5E190_9HYPO|nr:transcriptional regulatory [Fusarium beomiforme]